MKPTFRKTYPNSGETNSPSSLTRFRVSKRSYNLEVIKTGLPAPEDRFSREELRHIQNCIHFTQNVKGDEKAEAIAARSKNKGLNFL